MADISALYPHPQASGQQTGILQGNPLQVLGALNQVNQLKLFGQMYQARQAIGDAYKNNTNPDGTINQAGLNRDIGQNAGFMAGEGVHQALANQGQQIQNQTSLYGLASSQQKNLSDILGTTADNPTMENVYSAAAVAARAGIPPAMISSTINNLPKDPVQLKQALAALKNIAVGSAGTSGRVTGPPAATGAPTSISLGQANYGGPQGITTALPPGVGEAKVATGAGSATMLNDARAQGLNYQQQVFPLEQAIPALEKLGTGGTGPGTETLNHIKSFILSTVPGANFSGLKDNVAEYDKAKKYLTDFVNQNGNSSTNDKLAAAFAGNPSVNISNAAATDVAKAALSLRRMKQAQLTAFENSGMPESGYAKFSSQWNVNHDPRAYGFDLMSPSSRKAVLNSLPTSKRQLFMLDVQEAANNGIIHAPAH